MNPETDIPFRKSGNIPFSIKLLKSRVLFLLALTVSSMSVYSQNLVPNGSFEEGSECPMFLDDLHFRCDHWYKSIQVPGVPMNENPSPDWYHACSEIDELSTPDFVFGYQEPFDGSGLAALVCYDNILPNYREVIGIQLNEPLEVGQDYTISFKIALEIAKISTGFATNKFGVKFTTYPFFTSWVNAINNEAHVVVEELITDTMNWTLVNLQFTPDSAYTNLHLGAFFTVDQMDTVQLGSNFPRNAYYLIDDVSVSEGTLSTNYHEIDTHDLYVYPNPANEQISIFGLTTDIKVSNGFYQIISPDGSILKTGIIDNKPIKIKNLKKGLYILKLDWQKGTNSILKFIKS